jgi:hypothetical protein
LAGSARPTRPCCTGRWTPCSVGRPRRERVAGGRRVGAADRQRRHIYLAITLVRGEDGDGDEAAPKLELLVADMLESYQRQESGRKGRHAG